MRWAGPVAVSVFGPENVDYRTVRDLFPWKYLGFLLGGTALVWCGISLAEKRISARGLVIGLFASLALIALYDLPFDDFVLPPNGDV